MQATQLCQRCGYDLPGDSNDCPECREHARPVLRSARQVAGLELPTRSVHVLPAVAARAEPPRRRHRRRPSWAADLLAYTTLLALLTTAARLAALVARTDRVALQLPSVVPDGLELAGVLLAWATVGAACLTVVAFVGHVLTRLLARR